MVAKQRSSGSPHLGSLTVGTTGASSRRSGWPVSFCTSFCTTCMCTRGSQSPPFHPSTDSADGASAVSLPQGMPPLTSSSLPDNASSQTCSRTVCWWSLGPRRENELRSAGGRVIVRHRQFRRRDSSVSIVTSRYLLLLFPLNGTTQHTL
jgi:hypothetical protein